MIRESIEAISAYDNRKEKVLEVVSVTDDQYEKLCGFLGRVNSILFDLENEAKDNGDGESARFYDDLYAKINSVSCRIHEKFDPVEWEKIRRGSAR